MADRAEYRAFVLARSERLFRTAYLLTRNWATAEDLLQESLAKAWFAWRRLDPDPEAYVRKIIVTTYASWWRRRWRGEVPVAEMPETAGGGETANDPDDPDERDALWRALGRLPPRQRAIVVLRFYEDLPAQEVAGILGCAIGTVKSQTAKALAKLRVDDALNDTGPVRSVR